MQNGLQTEALDDFATAVREDPDNSDIYHHRGQVSFTLVFSWGVAGSEIFSRSLPTLGHP